MCIIHEMENLGPLDRWYKLAFEILSFSSYPVTSFEGILEHALGILNVRRCYSELPLLDVEAELFDQCHHFIIGQLYRSWIRNSLEFVSVIRLEEAS